uniref:Uncharacterized protein n=1 Tax=Lactuca sativa TaxID=4236 RepID=A0A9R1X774_LACSA|nr:hypothetical protein LSAT_V11C600312620 [Lactuca sativa]
MVMFCCRTKQAQLRALSNQFKRCYFQIHGSSSIIRGGTTVGVLKSLNSAFHRTGSKFGNCVKPKYEDKDKERPRMNEQISAQYVRIVTDEGMSTTNSCTSYNFQNVKRLCESGHVSQ